jgi:hypothetical protein
MKKLLTIAFLAGTLGTPSFTQSEKGAATDNTTTTNEKFYRLDFSAREVDGERIINNREYSTMVSNARTQSSIRTGAHVPISTGGGGWQNVNVGVDIDCKGAQEIGNQFQLSVRADINSVVENNEKGSERPITRSNSWESDIVVPLRRPTLLFSSDDPATKRKMQLVLTVTPVR